MCIRDSFSTGGNACNASIAITRLGGSATFLSSIGNDFFGHFIIKELKKENINTDHLLIKNKLVKYEEIQEGDKIKFIVLKEPNPLREKVISFPSTLPIEFNLHKFVNYDEQFDKSFLEPLRFIVNAINWNFEKQATLDGFF